MQVAANQSAASDLAAIPGSALGASFLALLGVPKYTTSLTFKVEAGGLLRCRAVYLTGFAEETAEKEWDVTLPRTSTLYKLITGETT